MPKYTSSEIFYSNRQTKTGTETKLTTLNATLSLLLGSLPHLLALPLQPPYTLLLPFGFHGDEVRDKP